MGSNPRIEPPYDLDPGHTVMLGIDFQQGFADGGWEHVPDAPAAVENFRRAAAAWRAAGGHVIMCRELYFPQDYPGPDGQPIAAIVENHPLMSGHVNAEFYPGLLEPGDIELHKKGFSAVHAGGLLRVLADHGWDTVVMAGLTTPICVGTTSDDLSMAGIRVVILEDACASQSFDGVTAQQAHLAALARFRYQFGQTLTCEQFAERIASAGATAVTDSP